MDPEVFAALEALRNALARKAGRRLAFLQLLYADSSIDVVSLPAAPPLPEGQGAPAPPTQAGAGGLRRQVLATLEEHGRPLKMAGLARRLGRSTSGHFRTTIRQMVEDGELAELPGYYYWVPGREAPREG